MPVASWPVKPGFGILIKASADVNSAKIISFGVLNKAVALNIAWRCVPSFASFLV